MWGSRTGDYTVIIWQFPEVGDPDIDPQIYKIVLDGPREMYP